ncbi:MAG: hypothetical protein FJ122_00185 [Deltaproteobacteria bacterium]|nr:hypothetical protein [Deltaproteobacteria bacterium]
MINTGKSTQDVLQQEILRERVAVLARTGENLAAAWRKLEGMEREIEAMAAPRRGGGGSARSASVLPSMLNEKIMAYNNQRERVRKCYYYLIVTREALGLLHHQRQEEMYRIPPKKRLLQESD